MEKSETAKAVPLMLRLPPDLHKRLVDRATANQISMNAQVVAILEHSLDASPEAVKKRALDQYRRILRNIRNAEAARQEAFARRDALRVVLLDLMKGEETKLEQIEDNPDEAVG